MKLKIKDENKRCLNFFWWHIWKTSLKKKIDTFYEGLFFGFIASYDSDAFLD
jgi:hypothetical protein